ncbi:MAG: Transglycosylase-associated protein [candidate division CPR2 bacterium GW2011_GWC1_39_9]|uniref:Transglycosylase-associated protein n=1 Tax=candidate division CPR2 bacterium GW2011_GWC2_39_10 TaxID=1618345 RepID=A0A0G0LNM6_UNCC2|nr:MAG: Transglycosylase-associated protein [candidate division CPR2 bacterium GW2011_GWC2_39_10]KKR33318.1 MAG: Transglycosylase-associated protein [candidate division CPR2 bacterium GW2011_GWC1_39_9]
MPIIYWIIFGLIAGSIANLIAPSSQGGIVGSIILGIIGAVVGGYLGQRFFGVGVTGFNLMSFVVAVAGALIVLFISNLLMRS